MDFYKTSNKLQYLNEYTYYFSLNEKTETCFLLFKSKHYYIVFMLSGETDCYGYQTVQSFFCIKTPYLLLP